MCKYSDNSGYKCPHENLEDSDYCIFHLQDDNKDVDEFNKGIKEILETEEDSINFNGFYFPPSTSDFSGQNFLKDIDFYNVIFSGKADFSNATFSRNAFFNATLFSKKAIFIIAKFLEGAFFIKTTFLGNPNFGATRFSEKTRFIDTLFSEKAGFLYAELTGKFEFIPEKSGEIDFLGTYFSDNVRLIGDLSKCNFANSNIERVDMTDSSWMRDNKPKKSFSAFYERIRNKVGLSDTSIIIWEEYQGKLSSNWKKLEGIYRRLKQSYQKYGDNSTAGKFYYQEMECKRKQLKGIEKLFWYLFYKTLCGYGEKPFNVIWASLILVFASACLFLFGGIEFVGSSVLKVPPNVIDYNLSLNWFGIQWAMSNVYSILEDFKLCLYTSVITFTTLGYGDVRPIGVSRFFASLEAGLGIIMTALFIFVFTRKMLR